MNHQDKKPHILFLFSDTGGGHRSAAEAIIEAMHLEFGDRFMPEMVDIFKDYAPPPLKKMPELYPKLVRIPRVWELGYNISDGKPQVKVLAKSAWPYVRGSFNRIINEHPSDSIISVHPLANAPMLNALGDNRPPFITVVTDLVSTHAAWYDKRVDLCLVPTRTAREHAIKYGLKPDQIKVFGLPVANRFCQPKGDSKQLRHQLGWPQDRMTVILVGGGEGMGPLEKIAHTIATAQLPLTLVIIAGRNNKLKERLETLKTHWRIPTFIYGFVHNMPDFMRAADVLVTKAGPGTISEALNTGLPIIMVSYLPGQETGNISYVISKGAGVWAPHPDQVVQTLRNWIEQPEQYAQTVAACQRAARPDAARKIAHIIADTVKA